MWVIAHSTGDFTTRGDWNIKKYLVCVIAALQATSVLAQQIPPKPLVTTPISPVRVEQREDGIFFIDFGRDAFAQLKLRLDHSTDQRITVRLGFR